MGNDFFADVLTNSGNESDLISSFWETHANKLNRRLLVLIEPEDVIMTASPSFLLDGIRSRLNTDQIICTEVDVDEKKITWFNFGENKTVRFRDLYGDRKIDEFYTDSYNDRALMKLARRVYIVKKGIPHRPGFDSWAGKIPWRRKWQPTPVFLPETPKKAEIAVIRVTIIFHYSSCKLNSSTSFCACSR